MIARIVTIFVILVPIIYPTGHRELSSKSSEVLYQQACKLQRDPETVQKDGWALEKFLRASDKGHAGAQCFVGLELYHDKSEYKFDYKRAGVKKLLKSAEQNWPYAFHALGCYYRDEELYSESFSNFSTAYKAGVAESINELANLYYRGNGIPQNYDKAFSLYLKAGRQSDAQALYNVALMYYYGHGIKSNVKKAVEVTHQCLQTNPSETIKQPAREFMAKLARENPQAVAYQLVYEKKLDWLTQFDLVCGAQSSTKKFSMLRDTGALSMLTQHAEAGNAVACKHLGLLYVSQKKLPEIQKNKIFDYLVTANSAEPDNYQILDALGHAYDRGLGVVVDYEQAKEYFYKAALSTPKDRELVRAADFNVANILKKQLALGDVEVHFELLEHCLGHGATTIPTLIETLQSLLKLWELQSKKILDNSEILEKIQNHIPATITIEQALEVHGVLGKLFFNIAKFLDEKKEFVRVPYYLMQAIECGNPQAMVILAKKIEQTELSDESVNKILALYTLAAFQGDPEAVLWLSKYYFDQKKYDEVIDLCRDFAPGDFYTEIQYMSGLARFQLAYEDDNQKDMFNLGMAALHRAAESNFDAANYVLGKTYYLGSIAKNGTVLLKEDHEKAAGFLHPIVEQNSEAAFMMCRIALNKDQHADAERYAALAVKGGVTKALYFLAMAQHLQKKYHESVPNFEKILNDAEQSEADETRTWLVECYLDNKGIDNNIFFNKPLQYEQLMLERYNLQQTSPLEELLRLMRVMYLINPLFDKGWLTADGYSKSSLLDYFISTLIQKLSELANNNSIDPIIKDQAQKRLDFFEKKLKEKNYKKLWTLFVKCA